MSDADTASTDAKETTDETLANYEEMLDTLDVAIDEAARKVESGRVYEPENERVRIKWIRALCYAVDIRRKVQSEKDLEELADRVEELEQEQEPRLKDHLLEQ